MAHLQRVLTSETDEFCGVGEGYFVEFFFGEYFQTFEEFCTVSHRSRRTDKTSLFGVVELAVLFEDGVVVEHVVSARRESGDRSGIAGDDDFIGGFAHGFITVDVLICITDKSADTDLLVVTQ